MAHGFQYTTIWIAPRIVEAHGFLDKLKFGMSLLAQSEGKMAHQFQYTIIILFLSSRKPETPRNTEIRMVVFAANKLKWARKSNIYNLLCCYPPSRRPEVSREGEARAVF